MGGCKCPKKKVKKYQRITKNTPLSQYNRILNAKKKRKEKQRKRKKKTTKK